LFDLRGPLNSLKTLVYSEIKICVADTGIGLIAEALEKICRKESIKVRGERAVVAIFPCR
jgi:hypothetical protein